MKDYHSIFYYQVIARLQHLRDSDDQPLYEGRRGGDGPNFSTAYEPRPAGGFSYHYQRDKFLNERSRLLMGNKLGQDSWDDSVIVAQESNDQSKIILYKDAVKYLFNDDEAFDELEDMLKKFYEVTIEERSGFETIDTGTGRSANHYTINDLQ